MRNGQLYCGPGGTTPTSTYHDRDHFCSISSICISSFATTRRSSYYYHACEGGGALRGEGAQGHAKGRKGRERQRRSTRREIQRFDSSWPMLVQIAVLLGVLVGATTTGRTSGTRH
eukprot:885335-Rhodomonas_salina.1